MTLMSIGGGGGVSSQDNGSYEHLGVQLTDNGILLSFAYCLHRQTVNVAFHQGLPCLL